MSEDSGDDDMGSGFSLITEAVVDFLASEMPEEYVKFFQACYERRGRIDTVLRREEALEYRGVPEALRIGPTFEAAVIPHPVHFREGMTVRNALRKCPACTDWSDHDYDNMWGEVVRRVLVKKGLIKENPNG